MLGYRLRYDVWYYRPEDDEWNKMRVSFIDKKNALDVGEECKRHKDVGGVMVTRTESALISDLLTKKQCLHTTYTAIRENHRLG